MTPYYQADGITLYCGDCRELAPSLQPADAVVTDPPYAETSLDWDVWPVGWPALMLSLSRCLWCFGSMRMFWDRRDEFTGWKLAQDLVWEKHNGSGLFADRFRRVHEFAVQFYHGDWGSLHKTPPIISVCDDERRSKHIIPGRQPAHWGEIGLGGGYTYDGKRIMRSVIPVASCHGYAVNETQKPEGIVVPLLSYSVPPGGLVLDPFAGSGTVLAVARAQGKRAIGIEKRESQCAEIVKRLAQTELVLPA